MSLSRNPYRTGIRPDSLAFRMKTWIDINQLFADEEENRPPYFSERWGEQFYF
jgi:hypothetical protein